MEKLDLKDRKILYHLNLNSRQSFSQIGKKVGLHKDVVAYRVKNLQDKGIIKNFRTDIDLYELGYTYLRFYINYQYTTPEIKEEIIDYFVKNKYTRFVHSTEGSYDLVIIMAVKNAIKFFPTWQKVFGKYRNYFSNQVFSVFCQEHVYRYSFLLEEKDEKTD